MNKKLIHYKGETKTIKEWCEHLGLTYSSVCTRLRRGYSIEDAFGALTFVAMRNAKIKRANNKIMLPSNGTFPPYRFNFYRLRKKETEKYLTDFLIRYERRRKWLILKTELGADYLNDLHRNCTYSQQMKVA